MRNWFGRITRPEILRVVIGMCVLLVVSSVVATAWKLHQSATILSALVAEKPQPAKPVKKAKRKGQPVHVLPEAKWVDSTFARLSPEEKIGQFFMVAAFSNRNEYETRYVEKLIRDYHLGGLIFFQGGPYRQAVLTNRFQAQSKVPLFIGIDGEWGLAMRLDSTMEFPKSMVLGAIRNDDLVYRMGAEIGRHCRRLGIHINFAPVSDLNSNPKNPVIGIRSFGEDRDNVSRKASAYMRGLQHNRVIATAKHFPGHGDTDADSHYTLPVVAHSSEQLREVDLYPYRKLIADSLMGVLSGHLYVPVLDNTPQLPSSLSSKVVTELLRNEMGFRGLVFTDAMDMKGVLKSGKAPDVNLRALMAGNDILVCPESVGETVKRIKEALAQGTITQDFIDEKVKRILKAKYWAGLNEYKPVELANLYQDLNNKESRELYRELSEAAVTVVRNDNNLLPIRTLEGLKVASVTVGVGTKTVFQKMLGHYAPMRHHIFSDKPNNEEEIAQMMQHLEGFEVVIVGVHGISSQARRNHGITPGTVNFVNRLKQQGKRVILCLFGSPYSIRFFPETDVLVCANQDGEDMQTAVPEVIFGALPGQGTLPVSVLSYGPGHGHETSAIGRMSYGTAESVGMNSQVLQKIDNVIAEAISERVFPGCQVLVARKGKVVLDKSYGTLNYRTTERVNDETLYDLASVTKVAATLQAVMLLYDRKVIDLDKKASEYLPELRFTNKQYFTVRDLLLHRSGLVSFYPKLWERTMTGGRGLQAEYYSASADSVFHLQVAPQLHAKFTLRDSVWKWVVESPLHNRRERSGQYGYVYSDLGFLTLQKIVERVTAQPMDLFLYQNIYEPLGLSRLGFNPLRRFAKEIIAPTEQDHRFRSQLIQGTAHDQMAAIQGGVSGHAGLFGTAFDVATLFQMNLWKGIYAGKQFFQPGTVPFFASMQDNIHHRGLGWDKAPISGNSSYVSAKASLNSFGHTGFTGAVVWADPDEELIFVFLSNRIHPDMENNGINRHRTRRKVHDLVYESLGKP
ncbi:glycoside hydrolase family 3 N-terminal domain-containing protein [Telluribacter sp.]|jgi:beta-glucosidase-like glycosyl hydrolase/CubicO group peptidase (beta-lactamase class C family)|uniref:glycoside hydrolase family 3 N-terminal domain-containing protein n=1 Tax=Telluribacter sp. TaxID=1978767 RepID=UPI002E12B154|nr:glycoside hydrolase family 3 N-terminal domain-containing protein [Telluribacter sp.]